jgi:hypothetical protein
MTDAELISDLRHQLQDMERERDVSRGNAAMHMEAARGLVVQLEAAQKDLRDEFAGLAMQACPMPQGHMHDVPSVYDRIAEHAYKMADHMLKARGVKA